MATFLMIHGAWHGGWCFEPLRALLERSGHSLVSPTLPDMGGSEDAMAAVTLAGWGAHVAALASARDEPIILCGHSRGGIVISDAAERAPERLAALVYISAFLVPDGRSLDDLVAHFPRIEAFEKGLSITAGGAAVVVEEAGARAAFYNACSEEQRKLACARLTAEPLAPMATPLSLTRARFGSVPRHYIECTLDRAIPLDQQRSMQAVLPCTSVTTLESDHSPFLCCPEELARALEQVAGSICS